MGATFTNLLYHLVFSTKHREPLIADELRDELYRYIGGIVREHGGTLIEAGGMPDHVHLVTPSIIAAGRSRKSCSSC